MDWIGCNINSVFLFMIYIDHALVDVDVEVAGVLRPAQQRGQQEGGAGEHRHQQGLRPAHPRTRRGSSLQREQTDVYGENRRGSMERDGQTDIE